MPVELNHAGAIPKPVPGREIAKIRGPVGAFGMEFDWVFWMAVVAVVLVTGAAMAGVARKREREGASKGGEPAPIYTSGVFSLIRKSPREAALARVPTPEAMRQALAASSDANGTAEQYRAEWVRVAELCIHNVEHGDKEGIQTYCYAVPEKCRASCGRFGGDAYVTRDQLHHHGQLIPPFHLGCGCEIAPRAAWSGSGGWSPILPVNGQYDTPDWRTVVRL
jgi:hypothetical protein